MEETNIYDLFCDYIDTFPIEEVYISWRQIEDDTGMLMYKPDGRCHDDNRKAFRRSLQKRARLHQSIKGDGLRLDGPTNAAKISSNKITRAYVSINTASYVSTELLSRHRERMAADDVKKIESYSNMLMTLRSVSEAFKAKPEAKAYDKYNNLNSITIQPVPL